MKYSGMPAGMWLLYALYMAIIVHKKGPIGGIFFYPKAMQERTIELGLITREELNRRKTFAFVLLIAWMLLIPAALHNSCTWHIHSVLQTYGLLLLIHQKWVPSYQMHGTFHQKHQRWLQRRRFLNSR